MKLLIPAVFGLVLLTGASGPGPLKDSMGNLFTNRDEMAPIARADHDELDRPHSPKASGCGSLDLGDGLAVLRKREHVPNVLGAVAEHEHELAFAD